MTKAVLRVSASLCVLAALAACGPKQSPLVAASSARPSPVTAQPQLTPGVVVTASSTELVIDNSGTPATFELLPTTTIMVAHKGAVADIKPGSFIGATNAPSADGTGQSTEVHIFPPGVS